MVPNDPAIDPQAGLIDVQGGMREQLLNARLAGRRG
jgi:hypothetical protein